MPHQNRRQQLLDILSQVKNTAIQSKYNDLVENIIEECLHTIDSDDNTDTDMSDLESDFAPSDPLSGNSMGMFDSNTSGQLSDEIFVGLIDAIGILEDEVRKARVLRARTRHSHAPQLHLLDEWALNNDIRRFRQKLRVDPSVFDHLVDMIENHPIFGSDRQLPCEIQLAIFLNRAGHYGNAATIQDIADWAGISVGSIYNCTNRVMIAIASLHDSAISWNLHDPDCIREKAKAQEWVESRTCGEWRGGYLTGDGSCFSLFQKPGYHGESFYDKKCNYSINCQVLVFFLFFFP
jgi:hypothetical protein